VAACGNATTETCGWITKRGKFNRCRAKLINQCKRFGEAVACPRPALPVTTTTTVPIVTTTTTTTTIPTTTLPLSVLWGGWQFSGTLVQNTCPAGTVVSGLATLSITQTFADTFYITQDGTDFVVTQSRISTFLHGGVDNYGGMTASASWSMGGAPPDCAYGVVLTATPADSFSTVPAAWGVNIICPASSCAALYMGAMSR
jgi:hypothetical protein